MKSSQLELLIRKSARVHDLDLRGSSFADANLSGLSADRLDCRAVDLCRAKLRAVRLGSCHFDEVKFADADWSAATLRSCIFDDAQGVGAYFDNARLEDSSAKGADLTRSSFRNAKLTETSFERAVLREAVLENVEGDGVQFRGADLSGAMLIGARLDEADFRGADLRDADLSQGRFHSADFRGAILNGARFDHADCTGARFDEGASPFADATTKTGEKNVSSEFDQVILATLREGLRAPSMFTELEGKTPELFQQVQSAVETLGAVAAHPSDDWQSWIEALIQMTKAGQPLDLKAVRTALYKAPTSLQNVFAMRDGNTAADLLDRLQHVPDTLDTASDHPPEEWKSWLEPLMKATKDGKSFDLKALLDVLSSHMQVKPLKESKSTSSHQQDKARS